MKVQSKERKVFNNFIDSTIEQAIKIGLDEYISKINEKTPNVTAQILQDRQWWKEQVFQRCKENLNRVTSEIRRYTKLDHSTLIQLKQLKHHFVISKVDKLSHM
jgi:hypothetical protein